jgi:hypothetical protein
MNLQLVDRGWREEIMDRHVEDHLRGPERHKRDERKRKRERGRERDRERQREVRDRERERQRDRGEWSRETDPKQISPQSGHSFFFDGGAVGSLSQCEWQLIVGQLVSVLLTSAA